ncbi:MAG: Rpn family recombination-promoting nuclease/putative transposase [Spirochaetia bacterium]|jgi:predicted transposase/invertase (TIGR01784 family)|nr:Rpn family recombination-promoting nuclease/putative transposase [Spirochaetia bacterium]
MHVRNVKDNIFKLIFGNHELFVEFLRDFIPIDILKNIRPEDVEDVSARHLPLSQEGRDSDTVKRVSLGGEDPLFVITILEHESKVNHRQSFKMLQYICLVLDHYEKDAEETRPGLIRTRDFRYPPVLPIVFYDGKGAWTAERNFAGRTRMGEVFGKYIPSFEYELVDLNRYSMQEITRFRDTLSVILAADKLPKQGGSAALEKLLREYAATLNIPANLRKLITGVLAALLDRLGVAEERIAAVTDTIEKKEENRMFDQLIAGMLEEREVIRKEASEKTRAEADKKAYGDKLESARKLKARGTSDEDIADILSLPVKDVAAL